MSDNDSTSSRSRRRSKSSKLMYDRVELLQKSVTDLQGQMSNMHVKMDLVLGWLASTTMAASTTIAAPTMMAAPTASTFRTPPHSIGNHSDHQSTSTSAIDDCNAALSFPIDRIPCFPFPSLQVPTSRVIQDTHCDEVDPCYTPRIDMSKFALIEDNFLDESIRQGDDLGDSSFPIIHDAANGSLAFGVNDYVNPGPLGSKDDGTRSFSHDDRCRTTVCLAFPFTDEDGFLDVEESLLKCDGHCSGEADSDEDLDYEDRVDWSKDPEFIAFLNGTWHPDNFN